MSRHRQGVVGVTVLLVLAAAAVGGAQDKPLAEKDIVSLIELQIDEAAIVGKLQKGGLSFSVDDAALARLKDAGATEAILKAVQAAGARKPAAPGVAPVTYPDVLKLVELGIDEAAILKRLEKSPTTFTLSAAQVAELKQRGATDALIAALRSGRTLSPQAAELITDFAIVLDCSGSMKEATPEGEAKMAAAKRVVTDLVSKIPDGLNVTFVIYGHEAFGAATDPRNCQAVKVARPLGPLDASGKAALSAQINGLQPTGATPIALSLKTAGAELAKNNAYCGLILITDGLETCNGDPVAEAAALAANPRLSFGVNVVGFGTKADEDKLLARIAEAGEGKYYDADSAKDLADAVGSVAKELETVAKKPDTVVSNRRAVKFPPPAVEMPPMAEIVLIETGGPVKDARLFKKGSITKYGEEIRVPSATAAYDIVWCPKEGEPIRIVKKLSLPERKVVELKVEDFVGFIKVNGQGTPEFIHAAAMDDPGDLSFSTQRAKKFGDVMVVPVGTYKVYVNRNLIEEGLKIEPGKLQELE